MSSNTVDATSSAPEPVEGINHESRGQAGFGQSRGTLDTLKEKLHIGTHKKDDESAEVFPDANEQPKSESLPSIGQ